MRLVDLGAGTGANSRFLGPALGGSQQWRLVDRDRGLLESMRGCNRRWARRSGVSISELGEGMYLYGKGLACTVRAECLDLAARFDALQLAGTDVVTASALFDLVSDTWMGRLVERCAEQRAAVLFALTYDGRIRFDPVLEEDDLIRALVNRHQLGDKGFGPAMGARAVVTTRGALEQRGYTVQTWDSAWRLSVGDDRLQTRLIEDWARAALEVDPARQPVLARWERSRLALVRERRSKLEVGHTDLFARPM